MILFIIILVLIILSYLGFKEEILNVLSVLALFAGVGALLFWILFGNPGLGAVVGGGVAHWLFRKMVLQDIWYSLTHLFG